MNRQAVTFPNTQDSMLIIRWRGTLPCAFHAVCIAILVSFSLCGTVSAAEREKEEPLRIEKAPVIGSSRTTAKLDQVPAEKALSTIIEQCGGKDHFPVRFQFDLTGTGLEDPLYPDNPSDSLRDRKPVTFTLENAKFWDAVATLCNHLDVGILSGKDPIILRDHHPSSVYYSAAIPPLLVFADRVQTADDTSIHLGCYYMRGEGDSHDLRFDDVEVRTASEDEWVCMDHSDNPVSHSGSHGVTSCWVYPLKDPKAIRDVRGTLTAIVAKERLNIYLKDLGPGEVTADGFTVRTSGIQSSKDSPPPEAVVQQVQESGDVWYWIRVECEWQVEWSDEERKFLESFHLRLASKESLEKKYECLKSLEDKAKLYSEATSMSRDKGDSEWNLPDLYQSTRFDPSTGVGEVLFYTNDRSELEKEFMIKLVRAGFIREAFSINMESKPNAGQ